MLAHLVLKSIAITVPPRISLEKHTARSTWLRGRYFETAEWEGIAPQWWYGGGTDITPSYIYDDDMKHFHGSYKKICDGHDPAFYPKFRQWYGAPLVSCHLCTAFLRLTEQGLVYRLPVTFHGSCSGAPQLENVSSLKSYA